MAKAELHLRCCPEKKGIQYFYFLSFLFYSLLLTHKLSFPLVCRPTSYYQFLLLDLHFGIFVSESKVAYKDLLVCEILFALLVRVKPKSTTILHWFFFFLIFSAFSPKLHIWQICFFQLSARSDLNG